MKQHESLSLVRDIMDEFASQTGLTPAGKTPRRYLWTDSFAVCNFLELYHQTGKSNYLNLAKQLVDQVHFTLGRHRADDPRTGWISGLDEQQGKIHPTLGGLRIGKELNERSPEDPVDELLEWDRDGQYFHYLTKWMHALNRVSRVTANISYNQWAIELAKTAHNRFSYVSHLGGQKYLYWKMSIDLTRSLVSSMGQHDPLDGLITYHKLQLSAAVLSGKSTCHELENEINDMVRICRGKKWVTDDALGIGGLLCDAYYVAQLMVHRDFEHSDLLEKLVDSALPGLEGFMRTSSLRLPIVYRLAFRELGLSIGLHAAKRLQDLIEKKPESFSNCPAVRKHIEMLMQHTPLIDDIESFWLDPVHRETKGWLDHRDINNIMLATSLAPGGFLTL